MRGTSEGWLAAGVALVLVVVGSLVIPARSARGAPPRLLAQASPGGSVLEESLLAGAGAATAPSASPPGSVLWTSIGDSLDVGPVLDEAASSGWVCENAEGGIVLRRADQPGEVVRIRETTGEIIIESQTKVRQGVGGLDDIQGLDRTLAAVFGLVSRRLGPRLPENAMARALYCNTEYYIVYPGTYHRMAFPPGEYRGVLDVPAWSVVQARFTAIPGTGRSAPDFRVGSITVKAAEAVNGEDVTSVLRSGSYDVSWSAKEGSACWVLIEWLTEPALAEMQAHYEGDGEDCAFSTPVYGSGERQSGGGRSGSAGTEEVPGFQPPPQRVRAELETQFPPAEVRLSTVEWGSLLAEAMRHGCTAFQSAGDGVDRFQFATESGELAEWVQVSERDGKVIVHSPTEVASLSDIDRLHEVMRKTVSYAHVVSGSPVLKAVGADGCYQGCTYRLAGEAARRYKRIVVPPGAYGKGELTLPEGPVREARVTFYPTMLKLMAEVYGRVTIGEGKDNVEFEGSVTSDRRPQSQRLSEGLLARKALKFEYQPGSKGRTNVAVVIEAMMSSATESGFSFDGEGKDRVVTNQVQELKGGEAVPNEEPVRTTRRRKADGETPAASRRSGRGRGGGGMGTRTSRGSRRGGGRTTSGRSARGRGGARGMGGR